MKTISTRTLTQAISILTLTAATLTACIKDDLYNTPHPDQAPSSSPPTGHSVAKASPSPPTTPSRQPVPPSSCKHRRRPSPHSLLRAP